MGLDHHGVARDERRGREAADDGEREVERPDAQPRPAGLRLEQAGFAGDGPEALWFGQMRLRLVGVEAEKVHEFAHLVHRVHERLTGLLHDHLGHGDRIALDDVGGFPQDDRAGPDRVARLGGVGPEGTQTSRQLGETVLTGANQRFERGTVRLLRRERRREVGVLKVDAPRAEPGVAVDVPRHRGDPRTLLGDDDGGADHGGHLGLPLAQDVHVHQVVAPLR
mmetsp:Transcript_94/g.444  ORF Transcript_94/g.444 Transcript_94/m.444 type:complete len:223 (+) Transcript_94:1297-1965(+)